MHSIRTAIAATLSLAVARVFGLPEAYWAAIATLVVMQSTLGATLLLSIERIAATALGALAGALLASYFTGNLLVFATAVFVLGLLCSAFRLEKTAYRYAGVTLAIIVLIPRSNAAWKRGSAANDLSRCATFNLEKSAPRRVLVVLSESMSILPWAEKQA